MNLQPNSLIERTNSTLVGFETLYGQKTSMSRVRIAIETLVKDRHNREKITTDFFMLLRSYKDFPLTNLLESLFQAKNSFEAFKVLLKIIDHMSYRSEFEDIRLILDDFHLSDSSTERTEKLLIQFLSRRSQELQMGFCSDLSNIYQEPDLILKIKKTLSFLAEVYDDENLLLLRKAYEHLTSLGSELQFYAYLHKVEPCELVDLVKDLAYSDLKVNIWDALSKGQMKSKTWALEELQRLREEKNLTLESALVLCGWIGTLSYLLFQKGFNKIASVDLDPECEEACRRINHFHHGEGQFASITEDIFKLDYKHLEIQNPGKETLSGPFDILINTSCEHIKNFQDWYALVPDGQLLLLQSNDYFEIEEHVNCVNSTAEFREQTPMSKRFFSGALPLGKYTRYMVIGIK